MQRPGAGPAVGADAVDRDGARGRHVRVTSLSAHGLGRPRLPDRGLGNRRARLRSRRPRGGVRAGGHPPLRADRQRPAARRPRRDGRGPDRARAWHRARRRGGRGDRREPWPFRGRLPRARQRPDRGGDRDARTGRVLRRAVGPAGPAVRALGARPGRGIHAGRPPRRCRADRHLAGPARRAGRGGAVAGARCSLSRPRRRGGLRGRLRGRPRRSRAGCRSVRDGPDPARLRIAPAPGPAAGRRAGAATGGAGDLRAARGATVDRAGRGRVARRRRDPAQPRRRPRRAQPAGDQGGEGGGGGGDEPGGRGAAVSEPEDDRLPSQPRLPEAGDPLPHRAGHPGRRGALGDPPRIE